jgi:PAS domain S-box-containing protein
MRVLRRRMGIASAVSALSGLAVLAVWWPLRNGLGTGAAFAASALSAILLGLGLYLARARRAAWKAAGGMLRVGMPLTEELLRLAVANAPLTFSLFDKDYRYLLATGKGLEARGVTEKDLLGRSALELYKNNPGAVDNLTTAMSGKSTQWSGVVGGRHLAAFNTPLKSPSGEVYGQVVISLDVTERMEAEKALRESDERFRALIQNSHDVVQLLSAEGVILYESPSVARVLGYAPEEMIGRRAADFVHPEDVGPRLEGFRQAVGSGGAASTAEIRIRHKDGSWRWIESTGRSLLDDPAVRAVVVNFRDVTDRKLAEDEIRALNAGLEKKVTERTEQLEEAVRELEAFSYSVSHDLRAPLRHIGGFVELLERKSSGNLDDEGRRYLGIVGQSAKRMDQLISNLLSFSRMSRQELRKSRFNMADLMGQCVRELQPDVEGRDILWEIADFPPAYGDQDLLRQVAANLLSNAAKFTRERGRARIEAGFLREEGQTVYFVRDNGDGFDMKYADKLFGVFQRLHDSSRFEGTGIGLANVRRVISRHGGRTWAEGKPGEGATFYFSLPDQPRETGGAA